DLPYPRDRSESDDCDGDDDPAGLPRFPGPAAAGIRLPEHSVQDDRGGAWPYLRRTLRTKLLPLPALRGRYRARKKGRERAVAACADQCLAGAYAFYQGSILLAG